MKNDEKNKEELNYKQAYYYIFNQLTGIIKELMIVQRNASEICIGERVADVIEISIDEVLQKILDEVKRNE